MNKKKELNKRRIFHIPKASCLSDFMFWPMQHLPFIEKGLGQAHKGKS